MTSDTKQCHKKEGDSIAVKSVEVIFLVGSFKFSFLNWS